MRVDRWRSHGRLATRLIAHTLVGASRRLRVGTDEQVRVGRSGTGEPGDGQPGRAPCRLAASAYGATERMPGPDRLRCRGGRGPAGRRSPGSTWVCLACLVAGREVSHRRRSPTSAASLREGWLPSSRPGSFDEATPARPAAGWVVMGWEPTSAAHGAALGVWESGSPGSGRGRSRVTCLRSCGPERPQAQPGTACRLPTFPLRRAQRCLVGDHRRRSRPACQPKTRWTLCWAACARGRTVIRSMLTWEGLVATQATQSAMSCEVSGWATPAYTASALA